MRHAPTALARTPRRLLRLGMGLWLALGMAAAPAGAADGPRAQRAPPTAAKATAKAPSRTTAAKARPRKVEPPRLPWVEGDYPRALADARARNVPLVVDVWAPW